MAVRRHPRAAVASPGLCALLLVVATGTSSIAPAAEPGPFRDCQSCPDMVVVPAGTFVMGTSAKAVGEAVGPAEATPVTVKIARPFAIGRIEVTRAQFHAFVVDAGVETAAGCVTWDETAVRMARSRSRTFENPGVPKAAGDDWPVSCVSWNDAKAYVRWLARKTGKPYRLPSEAEWEYAARGGGKTLRPWGDAAADGCDYANVYDLSTREVYPFGPDPAPCRDGFADLAPVGSLKPNDYGLYDMIGNVAEWVEDCYTDSYANRPRDGRAWVWLGGCTRHVVRGGSWLSPPSRARSAQRDQADAMDKADSIGFRVAVDLDQRTEAKP